MFSTTSATSKSPPIALWHQMFWLYQMKITNDVYFQSCQLIFRGLNTHTYCRAFRSGAVTTCLRLMSVSAWIRTPNLPFAGRTLYPTAQPLRPWLCLCYKFGLIMYRPFSKSNSNFQTRETKISQIIGTEKENEKRQQMWNDIVLRQKDQTERGQKKGQTERGQKEGSNRKGTERRLKQRGDSTYHKKQTKA